MAKMAEWQKVAGCIVILIFLTYAWSETASTRGTVVARFDIARDHYQLLGYGLFLPRAEYVRLLRERYGVGFKKVADCIVSESLVAYADSYNGEMTKALNRKYGRDVVTECARDARSAWEQAHREQIANTSEQSK